MKKLVYIAALFLMRLNVAEAAGVSSSDAQTVATNFYTQNVGKSIATVSLTYTEVSAANEALYYVFNINESDGFVIVSADDAAIPVLGYSNTGSYVADNLAPQFSYWMDGYKQQIVSIKANNLPSALEAKNQWQSYRNSISSSNNIGARTNGTLAAIVGPLLKTTWDQAPHYNDMCPVTGGNKALTGCVATAMAQIMKYWAYPAVGISKYQYAWSPYGLIGAEFDTSHYKWSAMPAKLSAANAALAELMYDCGVAVEMQYGTTVSNSALLAEDAPGGSSAQYAYANFFNYNAKTLQALDKANYTDSAWINILKIELNNGRPVQLGASAPGGGHSFVCDGYEANNLFDMNWGWSGTDNGYYAIGALNPGTYNYSSGNQALIGIQPPQNGNASVANLYDNSFLKLYPNPNNGLFAVSLQNIQGEPLLEVCNMLGQRVYQLKLSSQTTQINLNSQASGIYLYRVLDEYGQPLTTGKLCIQ